jgi:osmotically-inducible protein OsmY
MPYPFEGDADVDELVLTKSLNALHWDAAIPANVVNVSVRAGVVTLSGNVERVYQKSVAEALIRAIPEVVDVINDVRVTD